MQYPVYLDNNATTKVDEKVLEKMLPFFCEKYGNPSSAYLIGINSNNDLQLSLNVFLQPKPLNL